MILIDLLIDFIFPKYCAGCGKEGEFLCGECKGKLELALQICPMCCRASMGGWTHEGCKKRNGMDGLVAVYRYKNEVMKKAIEAIKFEFNRDLIEILLQDSNVETGIGFDYLVPVPLHRLRENWRGFNQAMVICKHIKERSNTEILVALYRTKNTQQQARIRNKKLRVENVKGAFKIREEVRGKNILLVDDVFTSGASMRECTKVLKRAGAKKVWGLVLAR